MLRRRIVSINLGLAQFLVGQALFLAHSWRIESTRAGYLISIFTLILASENKQQGGKEEVELKAELS